MKAFTQVLVATIAILGQVQRGDARVVRKSLIRNVARNRTSTRHHNHKRMEPIPAGTPIVNQWEKLKAPESHPRWIGWDVNSPDDEARAQPLVYAYDDITDLIAAVYNDLFDGEGDNAKFKPETSDAFKRWFGDNEPYKVWSIYNNMAVCEIENKESKCELAEEVGEAVAVREDWDYQCQEGGVNAYTSPYDGYFHFCDRGLLKLRPHEIDCDQLPDWIDFKAASPASILIHELTHWVDISGPTLGMVNDKPKYTEDIIIEAKDALDLDKDSKLESAENYALYANEAYFTAVCEGKKFGNPQ
ncbi:hypothetical protein ABW19_dt0204363 [Dactylella cylindrospora]|nr:hypothetical protein ABW19_dt0204363 [Dactylella cylindrospora]